ncbi:MAG: hypothetical protein NVV72_08230 [Asticcacaulis sp.]|nr:hypothetical protein [Asticcacaulis sp.]
MLFFRTRKSNELHAKISAGIFCLALILITAINSVDSWRTGDFVGLGRNLGIGLLFLVAIAFFYALNMIGIHLTYRPKNTATAEEIEAGRVMLYGKRKRKD